jgi:UDP:flavonoid glycosyltransferase YjiC (YdhE family)
MKIVFASLGSLGDLHPLLAIARAAEARGHTCEIALSRPLVDYTRKLGFTCRTIRPDLEPTVDLVSHLSHPYFGPERLFREHVFPACRETYADLLEICQGADLLVVGELLYVAPLVAETLNLPWANAILSPSSFLSAMDPCVLAPTPWVYPLRHLGTWPHQLIMRIGHWVTSRWARPLQKFRRELGQAPLPSPIFEGKYSPHLVLALFPEFFAPPQSDWPVAVCQTGHPFFTQPIVPAQAEQIRNFLAIGPPPIVFTLGSAMVHDARNFYELAAATLPSLGRRGLFLLGKNPVPPNLPPNCLALDYAPLELVVPGAAALVHHGGIGTTLMALRNAVPSVVVPFGYDQPDNAQRLKNLGVARVLRRESLTSKKIEAALRCILQTPHDRFRQLAEKIHPEQELAATLDALEKLGRSRTVSLRG